MKDNNVQQNTFTHPVINTVHSQKMNDDMIMNLGNNTSKNENDAVKPNTQVTSELDKIDDIKIDNNLKDDIITKNNIEIKTTKVNITQTNIEIKKENVSQGLDNLADPGKDIFLDDLDRKLNNLKKDEFIDDLELRLSNLKIDF